MLAASRSYIHAPMYNASPSVSRRISVRSVTGDPCCGSRWVKPARPDADRHESSVRWPSMTGGVVTTVAEPARAAGIWAGSTNGAQASATFRARVKDGMSVGVRRWATAASPATRRARESYHGMGTLDDNARVSW